jgi:hypothetical protein
MVCNSQVTRGVSGAHVCFERLQSPVESSTAAEYLAAQAAPMRLTADRWDGNALHIGVTPPAAVTELVDDAVSIDDQPRSWLGDLLPSHESVALVVAGGRGLRVKRATLLRYEAAYRVDPAAAIAGSPADDPWTEGLALPATWLVGVSYVFLLGYSVENQSVQHVRTGDGFDARLLDDLSASRPAT